MADAAGTPAARSRARRTLIPADPGQGANGASGVIPPGAWLVFEVELLDIRR
ncbi:FKBP-type peptidyl-prolyl cis-trans isomerase [Luteimonas granuli]|uniref:FKBP-type peptidyl-prolyl cis-trans isomerase n=1 Tax=Luteimonas granuli TaxID=1176533 RepID=UPI003CCC6D90